MVSVCFRAPRIPLQHNILRRESHRIWEWNETSNDCKNDRQQNMTLRAPKQEKIYSESKQLFIQF